MRLPHAFAALVAFFSAAAHASPQTTMHTTPGGPARVRTPVPVPVIPPATFEMPVLPLPTGGGNACNPVAFDLDRDGFVDLVQPDRYELVAFFGQEQRGRFDRTQRFAFGKWVQSLAPLDLEGDGDLDLAGTCASNEIALFVNDGLGQLTLSPGLAVAGSPTAIHARDLDGDGDDDLAFARASASDVQVWRNDGSGLFTAATYAAGTSPIALELGDLDGDGDPDLVACAFDAQVIRVLANDGAANFSLAASIPAVGGPSDVALGDLDGDGDLDLAVTFSYSGGAVRYSNLGGFAFSPAQVIALQAGPFPGNPHNLDLADFDGDGDLDYVIAPFYADDLYLVFNTGDGSGVVPVTRTGLARQQARVRAHDLDRDGRRDLVLVSNGGVCIAFQGANGGLALPERLEGTHAYGDCAAGDVDGDGDQDLLAYASITGGPIHLWRNNGSGRFSAPIQSNTSGLPRPRIADLNGDGKGDLIEQYSSVLGWRPSLGTGAFGALTITSLPSNGSEYVPVDVDQDGDLDLAVVHYASSVSVWTNSGAGNLALHGQVALAGNLTDVEAGDLDGDGDADLVVLYSQPVRGFRTALNDGAGNFTSAGDRVLPVAAVGELALVDLDADGDLDVATHDPTGRQLACARNTGTGAFDLPWVLPTGSTASRLACADFDLDGRVDFVLSGATTVELLLRTGPDQWTLDRGHCAGYQPGHAIASDWNGDGDVDLAVQSVGLYVLRNRRAP